MKALASGVVVARKGPCPGDPGKACAGLPDIVAPRLRVLFCGINPGNAAAAAGHHFVGRGNRFWRVLHHAGFTPDRIDPTHDRGLLLHGCGLTTAVARATARADQLSAEEFVEAKASLIRKLEAFGPRYIAFLGKAAFGAMKKQTRVGWGLQPDLLGGASVWVLPNPSGLNRSFCLEDLVESYGALWAAAWPEAHERISDGKSRPTETHPLVARAARLVPAGRVPGQRQQRE
jgi:TDG/mug DNA glycosylase family protein